MNKVTLTIPRKRAFKNVYQFKITLLGTNLPVWRRIVVPENYTFYDLHVAIQDAMGWLDYHLHSFETRTAEFGKYKYIVRIISPAEETEFDEPLPLYSTETPIKQYFKNENDSMIYTYDYGDGWEHKIMLEEIYSRETDKKCPICLAGELACPPEDCGAIPGYYECIKAFRERDNSEGRLDWLGDWDPDDFNPAEVKFEDPRKRFKTAFGD